MSDQSPEIDDDQTPPVRITFLPTTGSEVQMRTIAPGLQPLILVDFEEGALSLTISGPTADLDTALEETADVLVFVVETLRQGTRTWRDDVADEDDPT
jgi:hypothetical protein